MLDTLTRPGRAPLTACLAVLAGLLAASPARAALGDRTLREGDRGPDVRELQRMLSRMGQPQPVTGFYGPMTVQAVRGWERTAGERDDGRVDAEQVERMRRWVEKRSQPNGGSAPAPGPDAPPGRIDNPPLPAPPVSTNGYVFPIRGAHTYGTAINRFGAGRGGHQHRGHDVFAHAGTPIVAARGGQVTHRAFQGAAGNYLVVHTDDGTDHVYMHMQGPGIVGPGQSVAAGQQLGRVGCTGSCSGDHLHFEVWVGRWYGGGAPIDPLPRLRAWDRRA